MDIGWVDTSTDVETCLTCQVKVKDVVESIVQLNQFHIFILYIFEYLCIVEYLLTLIKYIAQV